MRHLFSAAGERALTRLIRRRVLLAFDFDGTLAPIVARPDHARVPAPIARRLTALARRCPIAIITGRTLADVRPRLGFEATYLVGNHGAEGLDWVPTGVAMQALRERLAAQAGLLQDVGVLVEDKGLSLALHFRLAPDRDEALRVIERLTADLPVGLSSFGGKCVLNIVSSNAPDKGHAAHALLRVSGCESLLFVGDDVNDEAVFEQASRDWLTVRIGRVQGVSHAMFFLDSHAEMNLLLDRIQRALDQPAPPSSGSDYAG